jgi:hypothetical protein
VECAGLVGGAGWGSCTRHLRTRALARKMPANLCCGVNSVLPASIGCGKRLYSTPDKHSPRLVHTFCERRYFAGPCFADIIDASHSLASHNSFKVCVHPATWFCHCGHVKLRNVLSPISTWCACSYAKVCPAVARDSTLLTIHRRGPTPPRASLSRSAPCQA